MARLRKHFDFARKPEWLELKDLATGAVHTDFKVFLGQIGWGASSFCAFREHVLPDGEAVQRR